MSALLQDIETEYEIERGKPMPSFNHGIIQMNLGAQFMKNEGYRVISELTLELDEPPHAVPDLCVFPRRPLDLLRDQIRVTAAPLLIVEILSPTQGTFEVMRRLDRYFEHGVKSCWIVEPTSHTVTIRTADGGETIAHEGVVTDPATGISADLAAVFS